VGERNLQYGEYEKKSQILGPGPREMKQKAEEIRKEKNARMVG